MQVSRMFVPTDSGITVGPGDLFMVTNTQLPEYGAVFECSGLDPENRICKWDEHIGFHYLNVEKVALFDCTPDVMVGQEVFVCYNVRFPGSVTRHYFEGVVWENLDSKRWMILNNSSIKVPAPKQHTFRKLQQLDNKIARYGNRKPVNRRLRTYSSV